MTQLTVLPTLFTIHRLPPNAPIPPTLWQAEWYWLSRTTAELSIVCPASLNIPSPTAKSDWVALQVIGPLDFAITGLLAAIATHLAAANISIFALSTYDTDYILIQQTDLPTAQTTLTIAGYEFC